MHSWTDWSLPRSTQGKNTEQPRTSGPFQRVSRPQSANPQCQLFRGRARSSAPLSPLLTCLQSALWDSPTTSPAGPSHCAHVWAPVKEHLVACGTICGRRVLRTAGAGFWRERVRPVESPFSSLCHQSTPHTAAGQICARILRSLHMPQTAKPCGRLDRLLWA